MPNGTYGGVRGEETKVGQKTFVSRPTRFTPARGYGRIGRNGRSGILKSANFALLIERRLWLRRRLR